jgi:hypothetical protein
MSATFFLSVLHLFVCFISRDHIKLPLQYILQKLKGGVVKYLSYLSGDRCRWRLMHKSSHLAALAVLSKERKDLGTDRMGVATRLAKI